MGLFSPSRREIWKQLSDQIGAEYVDGGFWRGDKVEARHGEWIMTLDTFAVSTGKITVVYTRMRAPYVNTSGFRFTLYRRSAFSDLGKFFGMQDIEVGHTPFDDDFIVKANDEHRVRALLANPTVRALVEQQPDIHLSVQDDEGWFGKHFPEGVDELYFRVTGIIKDIDRLKRAYELFAETLDELCRLGAADNRPPQVRL